MTTYRVVKHERDFTQIQNSTLRDERLSFRARGVLAWLLSHVDTWEVSREQIARNGTEGVTAIRSAQAELTALGYLQRVEQRTLAGTIYYVTNVYEVPVQTAGGLSANGSTANGSTANGESHDIEDHLPQNHFEEEHPEPFKPPIEVVVFDCFEDLWTQFPKIRGSKAEALKRWNGLTQDQRTRAVDALPDWLDYWHARGPENAQFIPSCASWLGTDKTKHGFDEFVPPITQPPTSQGPVMDMLRRLAERDA